MYCSCKFVTCTMTKKGKDTINLQLHTKQMLNANHYCNRKINTSLRNNDALEKITSMHHFGNGLQLQKSENCENIECLWHGNCLEEKLIKKCRNMKNLLERIAQNNPQSIAKK